MRWINQMLVGMGLLLVSNSVHAVPATQLKENYQSIIERNAFGLKPPPPPATNGPVEPPKPKLEVFLTGITAIGYPKTPKQAYFYTREQGKKDKEVTYYALPEGAEKDGIEILEIDPDKRKVRVRMDNSETLLSFDTHGVPTIAVPAGRPLPGVPQVPTHRGMQPNLPMPLPAAHGNAGYDSSGQPNVNQAYNTGADGGVNTTMNRGSTGLRQIPSRRIRGGGSDRYGGGGNVPVPDMNGSNPQMQEAVDPAEEYVRAHLNRTALEREAGNIPVPPLPTLK